MPVYAYACKDCGHAFDIRQSFSENALTECPECNGGLRKKFNTVGVVFKGSGFYRNDSRGSGEGGSAAPAGGSTESSSERSSEKSTEKSTPKSSEKSADRSSSGATPARATVGASSSGD
ncbi:FmdB family zinc ribbon protein [Kocuria sp. M1R5S2]|uniref:FmdB family zinc ribbon protein n=1 Tax=Kocuria rhizosphaerae TaxID=3376285 RepID=UPI0037888AEB